jgi:hypothetical protein
MRFSNTQEGPDRCRSAPITDPLFRGFGIPNRSTASLVQRAGRDHPFPIFAGSPWRERDIARRVKHVRERKTDREREGLLSIMDTPDRYSVGRESTNWAVKKKRSRQQQNKISYFCQGKIIFPYFLPLLCLSTGWCHRQIHILVQSVWMMSSGSKSACVVGLVFPPSCLKPSSGLTSDRSAATYRSLPQESGLLRRLRLHVCVGSPHKHTEERGLRVRARKQRCLERCMAVSCRRFAYTRAPVLYSQGRRHTHIHPQTQKHTNTHTHKSTTKKKPLMAWKMTFA